MSIYTNSQNRSFKINDPLIDESLVRLNTAICVTQQGLQMLLKTLFLSKWMWRVF